MKNLLILFSILLLTSIVSGSTNCSTGCDVTGGTFFDTNIDYLNWNSSANDASLKIKSSNGNVIATKTTNDVINWGNSQLMSFYPQIDGNYTLEVFSQGTDNNYQLKLDFNSLGVLSTYYDTNCTGTSCGGSTKIYKLNVANSSTIIFDDNRILSIPIKGGMGVAINIRFFEGANCGALGTPCDVSMAIRRLSDNNVVAYKSTGGWSDWLNSTLLDWNADYDGNYAFEVFYEGGISRYDVNISFTDVNGSFRQFQDYSQYIGTSLATGQVTQYFFQVTSSPPLAIHDEQTFSPAVKGTTVMNTSIKFYDGHNCGAAGSPCDVSIGVRRLSDNNRVAYKTNGSWSNWSSPVTLDWLADYNDSYSIEVFYEGSWGQYDVNISYADVNNIAHLYTDTNQYIGSGLGTGNTTRYLFSVQNASARSFDDGKNFLATVKGGALLVTTIKFYDGHDCGALNSPCDVSIGIRRLSDNNIVAYRSNGSWSNWQTPTTLDWYPDYDGAYVVEIFYEGTWAQYDLNVSYQSASDTNIFESDSYSYIGSGLATGGITQYFFNTTNSPEQLLDDMKTVPYKATSGQPFSATIKMYDGHTCGALNSPCDATFAIKDTNGSTIQLISTGDYSTLNNTTIQFNPISNHIYFIETTYEGTWVQFDLNVNYTDTAGIVRHFEDKTQYIGSGLSTGGTTQHFFESGASCGNGIYCPPSACIPLIINGPSELTAFEDPAIDIVFSGSGFPDRNSFQSAIEFLIDYEGAGDGLFSYEPFKSYKNRFNIWFVDEYKTYNLTNAGGYWKFENFLSNPGGSIRKDAMDNCPHGNEFVAISVYPRFRAASANAMILGDPIGAGGHFAQLTVGCEILGTCPYPLDANYIDPNTSFCDGNATLFKTIQNPTVGCDNVADFPEAIQRVFVHEFGHSFGGLADEYTYSNITPLTNFAPNCDVSNICSKWTNFSGIDCNSGCSYSNWYRPYQDSIMLEHRLERHEFGAVSENELENDIVNYSDPIFGSFDTFVWGVSYQNGNFTSFNGNIVDGIASTFTNQPSSYKLKVYSNSGNLLMDSNFLVPNQFIFEASHVIFDENGNQVSMPDINTIVEFSDENFFLPIPLFSDIGLVRIFDENMEKLSIDLSEFSTRIQYTLGYGSHMIDSNSYKVEYSLVSQPTGRLTSTNYIMDLGIVVEHE